MDSNTIDFSLPNIITIALIGALWYLLIVGGYSLYKGQKTVAVHSAPPSDNN